MTPIEIAKLELGTVEYPKNSNAVKYNTWYYKEYVSGNVYPWCVTFVQWVYNAAGINLYRTASCSELLRYYKTYYPERVVNDPVPNAILIYDFGHCGICVEKKDKTVVAIEGNTSVSNAANGGCVMQHERQLSVVKGVIDLMKIPAWAMPEYQRAIEHDITDGSNPLEYIPRYQAAIMAERARNA